MGQPTGILPYAWYHLNENGGATLSDSANSHTMTLSTTALWSSTSPKLGAACLYFTAGG